MSEKRHKNHSGFAGGTLVHTENGLVAIKNIKVGEKVLSREQSGDVSYLQVKNITKTEHQLFYFLSVTEYIGDNWIVLLMEEKEKKKKGIPIIKPENMKFLATANHPFWVEEKGWVTVENLESGDVLLDNKQRKFTLQHPGYDGDVRAKVYKTAHPNIGFLPNYGLEYSVDGSYIDLTTGKEIQDDALQRNAENDPTLAKLYQNNPEWEQDLREELDVPEGEPAEFFGFKTGEWVDPSSIGTDTLATTTVYNLEVENTHTYFVGEEGILVSDCHF